MSRKEDRKRAWLAALNLKYPTKRVYVCIFHFIAKKPTELHSDPELYLGYDRPPPKKRRRLISVSQTASSNINKTAEFVSSQTRPASPHNLLSQICTQSTHCGKILHNKIINTATRLAVKISRTR
ncbi:uncharacterized protein si:ch211-113p18.3 [Girardinichthys multiradiatus]|uniref:uncharacterized protein si:ch211-113p18.3 n=1 Tax=Girardinichthys multiradiatus TaxID=208333 RepID=UPI001FACD0C4|nr:uncharacterized protein si:ch211-113p18.3 [Girardinichthys multiradiatus]